MKLEQYERFTDAKTGSILQRPVLITSISENTARNGNPFIKMVLKDGFSDVIAVMFDVSVAELELQGIQTEMIADTVLSVSEYQGSKSFRIMQIRPASDSSLTINDFTKIPPIEMDNMFEEICSLIEKSKNNYGGMYIPLASLAFRILEVYKSRYMTSSAAVSVHHNIKGGLLYHSYGMIKAADALCDIYNNLDRELVLCGAALHDIGKLWKYETSATGEATYTVNGVLFGHLYIGASLIRQFVENENYYSEKVRLLIHSILAHHGTQEWGTVSCPAIPEAYALHLIDNLDVKMYIFEEQFENMPEGTMTEKRPFGMENKIHKPNYNPS